MGKFIKYRRIKKIFTLKELDIFFDDLIKDNCDIIYYNENHIKYDKLEVTVVFGKKNISDKQIL